QVAAYGYVSGALRADGTVVVWGRGWAVDSFPSDLTDVVQIALGEGGGAALLADGTVRAWGVAAVAAVPPGLTDVVAIEANRAFHALRQDGSVVTWGVQIAEYYPFRDDLEAMLP